MEIEKFNGTWKFKSAENFDQYMKELGVNFATRKIGGLSKPNVIINVKDSSFYLKSDNTFKSFEVKCTLGNEWDEVTPDGRKCKSIISWDGEKFIHVQKWNDKETTITRSLNESGELVMELVYGNVKSTRVYTKV